MFRIITVFMVSVILTLPCHAFITVTHTTTKNPSPSIQNRIVDYVHKTINTRQYSKYKMGGSRFDPKKGGYIVDCSNYVDQILQTVSPLAYLSLVNSSGSDTPTTRHYFDFFSDLSTDPYWDRVEDIENLRPGDIIVFRYKKRRRGITRGHVMVVMDNPIRDEHTYLIRVADSAPTGHSNDTRPAHSSGIGIGTFLLKINPKTGQPAAYAWRRGSIWEHNATFAMARPIDINEGINSLWHG